MTEWGVDNTRQSEAQKNVIKFFGPLFSQVPKLFTTADWVDIDIFDTPTQFFIYSDNNSSVYWKLSEQLQQVVYKIMKDNNFLELVQENMTLEHITQFRRLFRKHPEIEMVLSDMVSQNDFTSSIEWLNLFFNEMLRLKIYDDKHLNNLREFRMYIAQKSISYEWEISEDIKMDLFYFLEFDRFGTDDEIRKEADRVLVEICKMIEDGICPDIRGFKAYNDRDAVPDEIISMIEKLVLMNYCDKPDKSIVEEIRTAVKKMDLKILKEYLWFNPRWRQRHALIFESRENLAANSRRSWKSRLMVYIAIRQIFLPWQMILYMLPVKEDYSEQPFFYIEQMMENIKKMGGELTGFQFNAKQFRVVNKNFKSKIIFISAQGSSKGKSFSANLVIMDEAPYMDSWNLYEQASNSTSDTKWRMWAVWTINIDTPINWFFYKKVNLEGIRDCKVFSVDIYNNPFMTQEEKDRKEKQFKNRNQNVWLADWMAIFVGWTDGFDISRFFKIDFVYDVVTFKGFRFNLARNLDKYSRFLVSYDPAKTMDKAWISIIWLSWKSAEVVLTGYIDIKNYYLQWDCIIDILEYMKKFKTIEYVIDLGKAWEAAFDYFEARKYSPYGILATGWNIPKQQTYRRWNVPAQIMEKTFHSLLSAGVVTWFSWLEHIRNEFETYNLSKEREWNVWHHHDVLSSLMQATYVRYERWLIWFDIKQWEKKESVVVLDAYWRPIKSISKGQFDWGIMWRFIH